MTTTPVVTVLEVPAQVGKVQLVRDRVLAAHMQAARATAAPGAVKAVAVLLVLAGRVAATLVAAAHVRVVPVPVAALVRLALGTVTGVTTTREAAVSDAMPVPVATSVAADQHGTVVPVVAAPRVSVTPYVAMTGVTSARTAPGAVIVRACVPRLMCRKCLTIFTSASWTARSGNACVP